MKLLSQRVYVLRIEMGTAKLPYQLPSVVCIKIPSSLYSWLHLFLSDFACTTFKMGINKFLKGRSTTHFFICICLLIGKDPDAGKD